jgi:hypothetical protein
MTFNSIAEARASVQQWPLTTQRLSQTPERRAGVAMMFER